MFLTLPLVRFNITITNVRARDPRSLFIDGLRVESTLSWRSLMQKSNTLSGWRWQKTWANVAM